MAEASPLQGESRRKKLHASKPGSYLGGVHDEVPVPQTAGGDKKVKKGGCLNGKSSSVQPRQES